jgi:hypothetical protein
MFSFCMKHFSQSVFNNHKQSFNYIINIYRPITQGATRTENMNTNTLFRQIDRFEKNNENSNKYNIAKNSTLYNQDDFSVRITRYFGIKSTEEIAFIQDVFNKMNDRFD